jgi:hypothetical protein
MDRPERQLYYASKRERLLAITIFLLMLISFFIHLSAFADVFLQNMEFENNQTQIKSIYQFFFSFD